MVGHSDDEEEHHSFEERFEHLGVSDAQAILEAEANFNF